MKTNKLLTNILSSIFVLVLFGALLVSLPGVTNIHATAAPVNITQSELNSAARVVVKSTDIVNIKPVDPHSEVLALNVQDMAMDAYNSVKDFFMGIYDAIYDAIYNMIY